MRSSRLALYDSYASARGSLQPLFSPFRSPDHLRSEVRRHLLTRSRHLDRLGRSQQRSWVRGNVTLLLQEARRRKNYAVAEAALQVALAEPEWIDAVDPAWIKDTAAACGSAEELRRLQRLLASGGPSGHVAQLQGAGSETANLLAMLMGGSVGPTAAAASARLGDGDADAAALAVLDENCSAIAAPTGRRDAAAAALGELLSPKERVALALTRPHAEAAGDTAGSATGLAPHERTLAAMRRLEDQREAAVVAPNQSFSRYFLRQGIVKSESELQALFQAMRARPDEIGFRVHLSHPYGAAAQQLLSGREGVAPVTWLPSAAGAYTLNCRNTAALQANRVLLKALSRERVLSFQTTSSMLPVYFLDPRQGERVLDMCASPGSKSTLIIDMLQTGQGTAAAAAASSDGCVCANEANEGRARDLESRLQNYATQVAVTRANGETFGLPRGWNGSNERQHPQQSGVDNYFDKVLVDAPCSGEGRLGRDPMAWRLWHPGKGLDFFPRQVALLQRAVEVCRPGGTVVYATCTLNPLENEAVVAAVLPEFANCLQLEAPPPLRDPEEASGACGAPPLLSTNAEEARPMVLGGGLRQWVVPSAAGGFYATAGEALAQEGHGTRLPPAVFFPGGRDDAAAELDAVALSNQLQRCCRRVLPHHNGAGSEGFFVAVLRKTGASSARQTSPAQSLLAGDHRADRPVVELGASLLHSRGLARLPVANSRLQGLLSPFLTSAAEAADPIALITGQASRGVEHFLSSSSLVPLWRDGEGLRLASQAAVELAKRMASSDGGGDCYGRGASTRLLETGILAFDAAGALTASGASLLRPHASSRVLAVPATSLQLLLANRQLDVAVDPSGASEDPTAAALRVTSNNLACGRPGGDATGGRWAAVLVAALALHGAGNAIVVLLADSAAAQRGRATAAQHRLQLHQAWAPAAAEWALPVHAEVIAAPSGGNTVRLKLLLSREARHRATAMIGRLQGRQGGSASREAVAEYAAESGAYRASHTMSPQDLFGTPAPPTVATRGVSARAAAPAPAAANTAADADDSVFEF